MSETLKSMLNGLKLENIRPEQWLILACIAGVGLLIYCIFLGATNRIVFYRNKTDMFLSFLYWVLALVLAWFAMTPENREVFQRFCIIVIGASLLQNIFTAWKHNPGIYRLLAIPIGVSKTVLGLLFVATWVEVLFGSTKKRRNQTIQMGILAGLLSGLIYALVNGDEVMDSRPEK